MTEVPDRQPQEPGEHGDGDRADGEEDKKQPAVGGEQSAEGKHGAQVGNEAGGENELAEVVTVQSCLNHDRVDHRNRCRAERDAADLGSMQVPAENEAAESERGRERHGERHQADGQAGSPVAAQ